MGFWTPIFGRREPTAGHREVYLRTLGFYFEPLGIDFGFWKPISGFGIKFKPRDVNVANLVVDFGRL